jgi:uncharacterized protein (UPF0332 family)
MTNVRPGERAEIRLYVQRAREMLEVAQHNLEAGFDGTAVNRAYYAIFYAANAVLASENIARGSHSGVISVFRERFVKPGVIEAAYSRIYGRVMDDRHLGDYEIERVITSEEARQDVEDAGRFVSRLEAYLKEVGRL